MASPMAMVAFAPHTRGSTVQGLVNPGGKGVCPAHAGVYLITIPHSQIVVCLPRTRGGLPPNIIGWFASSRFAPHTRGSTHYWYWHDALLNVCPAHAGVYPMLRVEFRTGKGLPRTRGGLPFRGPLLDVAKVFAPHTRGSTGAGKNGRKARLVCPAHAGVYPNRNGEYEIGLRSDDRLPRTRGGLPEYPTRASVTPRFAPHTRGCQGRREGVPLRRRNRVPPAR